MVACGIVDERLEFTVGFEVVVEGEDKRLDTSLSNSDTRPLIPFGEGKTGVPGEKPLGAE